MEQEPTNGQMETNQTNVAVTTGNQSANQTTNQTETNTPPAEPSQPPVAPKRKSAFLQDFEAQAERLTGTIDRDSQPTDNAEAQPTDNNAETEPQASNVADDDNTELPQQNWLNGLNLQTADFVAGLGEDNARLFVQESTDFMARALNGNDEQVSQLFANFLTKGLQNRPKAVAVDVLRNFVKAHFGDDTLEALGVDFKKANEYLSHLAKINDELDKKYKNVYSEKEKNFLQKQRDQEGARVFINALEKMDKNKYPLTEAIKSDIASIIIAMQTTAENLDTNLPLAYEAAINKYPALQAKRVADKIKNKVGSAPKKDSLPTTNKKYNRFVADFVERSGY